MAADFFKYHWKCPYCLEQFHTVTQGGCRSIAEQHLEKHEKENRENMILFAQMPTKPPEYYQTLRLTWADIQFLRTRQIKIEPDMEWIDCQWCMS